MNSDVCNERLASRGPSWRRLLILILSLVQSYMFAPAIAHNKYLVPAAEAAEQPGPANGRAKRGQAKASAERNEPRRQSIMRKVLRGKASWYGPRFHGRKTATGEIFDQRKLTAAHKTLPLGTKAIVKNLENGNTVEVEINDRGPYVPGRVIDLSYAAAKELGFVKTGIALVEVLPLLQTGEIG